jgi:hypothetical protein
MYFERWGLLAPPPGKASVPKTILLCFSRQRYYTLLIASVQHAACRRAGVQETNTYASISGLDWEDDSNSYGSANHPQNSDSVDFTDLPNHPQVTHYSYA